MSQGEQSLRQKKPRLRQDRERARQNESAARKIGMPKLSACMIVKNEETMLERCLSSIKDIADEIIIVDTGSTDGTMEIARNFTDKIYFHQWEDNFSKARNHSISYASGDWILIIDADEELVGEDIPILKKALQDPHVDAISFQVINQYRHVSTESRLIGERIIRNNGIIRYEGRVHNRLVGINDARRRYYPIRLLHFGYGLSEESNLKKFDRTVSLLKKDLEENPLNPLTHHYLSCSYFGSGYFTEAREHSMQAISLAAKQNNSHSAFFWTRYIAAMSHYHFKDYDKAEDIAIESISKCPWHIDAHFVLIIVYYELQKWQKLIEHGEEYIKLVTLLEAHPEEFGNIITNSLDEQWNIHSLIAFAQFELGKANDAKLSLDKALAVRRTLCFH